MNIQIHNMLISKRLAHEMFPHLVDLGLTNNAANTHSKQCHAIRKEITYHLNKLTQSFYDILNKAAKQETTHVKQEINY